MNIQVYPHRIILNKTNEVNTGEYNVNECTFEFSQEYEGLTKVAVFSLCDGTTKNVTILNNQCIIPVECLQETGQVQIGVYGYAIQDNELVLRYSPTPQNFVVKLGSYKEGTQPVAPTPTDWEILVEQVSDIAEDVSSIHEDITGINGEISGINIDIKDLQDTKANISDLAEVAFTGEFSDLKNIPSYATTQQLNQEIQDRQDADVNLQSQIDAISVSSDVVDVVGTYQELLDYDTTHLKDNDIVKVLQDSTHSDALSYYRWDKETSTWSYVGSEGPFYTKSETDALLNYKQDVIDIDNMLSSDLVNDTNSINKFVTEADINNWNNKEDKSNKVTEINSSSTDTQYPSAKCVYDNQEEQNEQIAELEMLYNAFPTVSAENETIQLDNTAKVKFREIDLKGNTSQVVIPEEQGTSVSNTSIYVSDVNTDKEHTIEMSGNTYQETTTGKNLFNKIDYQDITLGTNSNPSNVTKTNNSISYLSSSSLNFSGVFISIANIANYVDNYDSDTTYCISADITVDKACRFGSFQTTTDYADIPVGTTRFSVYSKVLNTINFYVRTAVTNGVNVKIENIMVTTTNDSDYEPYTYGASPNPDYPQNIEVVTGTQNVEVCGKNFIPTNINDWESGQYNVSGTKQDMASRIRLKELLPIKPNTTYYFDIFDTTEFSLIHNFIIRECDKNGSVINSVGIVNNQSTYTSNNNAYYLMVTIGTSSTTSGETFENYQTYFSNGKLKPFICLNSTTDKSYEAYQGNTYPVNLGNIELCKIDTYQDRIYKKNDKWYLEKQIGKVVLNGTQPIIARGTITTGYNRFVIDIGTNIYMTSSTIEIAPFYCNEFIPITRTNSYNNINGIFPGIENNFDYYRSLGIYYDATKKMTSQQFQTWLSQNNAIVYYPYATPTTTEITDTALVNQLNALYNATIYPITNINTDTSNLLPYIDLHYNFVTPSPSPSRPSVVNVVKGNNTITISNSDNTESQNYPINLGDMELCKIGTYQDYIYESNGNWYLKKQTIKYNLSDLNYLYESSATTPVNRTVLRINNMGIKTSYFSNVFDSDKQNDASIPNRLVTNATQNWFLSLADSLTGINSSDSTDTKVQKFVAYIQSNNVFVITYLATPTDTQITDTTLITQLNNIKKAYSYDTQTNISQTNTDKPFIIYAEAIRSLKDVFE